MLYDDPGVKVSSSFPLSVLLSAVPALWTFQPSLREQKQTNHIVLSGILACSLPFMTSSLGTSMPLLIQGPQESQWFLTSQFDKSGGYTLIPLIWPFSRAQPQGERDHRE